MIIKNCNKKNLTNTNYLFYLTKITFYLITSYQLPYKWKIPSAATWTKGPSRALKSRISQSAKGALALFILLSCLFKNFHWKKLTKEWKGQLRLKQEIAHLNQRPIHSFSSSPSSSSSLDTGIKYTKHKQWTWSWNTNMTVQKK